MKVILLLCFFAFVGHSGFAQTQLSSLPSGRYETIVKETGEKWKQGDIILLDASQYKISSNNEVGEYKFSATAQRIFFISGPLKTVFAKAVMNANKPAIVLPAAENEQQGSKLATADVVAYFKN
jgi:hypothetical protein